MSMYADAEEKKQKTVKDLRQRIGKLSDHMGLSQEVRISGKDEPPWKLLRGRSHSRSLSPVQVVITRSRSPSEESERWRHDKFSGDEAEASNENPTFRPQKPVIERIKTPETPPHWQETDVKEEPGNEFANSNKGHLFPIVAENAEPIDSSESSSSDSSSSEESSSSSSDEDSSSESSDSDSSIDSSEDSSSDESDSDDSSSDESSSESSSDDSYRSRSSVERGRTSLSPPPPGLKYKPPEVISSVVNVTNRDRQYRQQNRVKSRIKSHVVAPKASKNKENLIPLQSEELPFTVRKGVPDLRGKLQRKSKKHTKTRKSAEKDQTKLKESPPHFEIDTDTYYNIEND